MMVITGFAAKFFTLENNTIEQVGGFSLNPENKHKQGDVLAIGKKMPDEMEREVRNLLSIAPRVGEAYLFSPPGIIEAVKNMLPEGLVNKIKKEFTGEYLNSKPEILMQEIKTKQGQEARMEARERVSEMKPAQEINTFGIFSTGGVR